MVTILSRPYDGLAPKQNTVYNGLPFVVDSNKKTVPNFRYIAEVFVDGSKITELRHNGDISGNNNGIFDIGRVVENYITYDTKHYGSTLQTYPGYNSNRYYHVQFGEEFTRKQTVKKIYAAGGGDTYILFNNNINLRVGDRVLISGSNVVTYNGYKEILSVVASNIVRIGTTFTTAPTNYPEISCLEGERISQFGPSPLNGSQYLTLYVNINNGVLSYTRYNVGDIITINQDALTNVALNSYQYYENTEWKILQKTLANVDGTLYAKFVLDAPYKGTPSFGGSVVSKENYVLKNQISTSNDFSYAFNGVIQYNDTFYWNPMTYNWANVSVYPNPMVGAGKFLTKDVDRKHNVALTDYWTLSTFGKQLNQIEGSTFIARAETWSTPTQGVVTGTASQEDNLVSNGSHTIKVTLNAGLETTYGVGDYVTLNIPSIPYLGVQCRIVKKVGNVIYTDFDLTISPSTYACNIVQTIKVKYRIDAVVQNTYTIIPCGPANFIDSIVGSNEFTDGTCYKYFIWIGKYQSGSALVYADPTGNYDVWSEKFEFDITPECTKFKNYKLTWLNEMGGFDYYKFNMRSDKTLKIERNEFTRKLKSQTTNGQYNYLTGDRGRTVYNVNSVEDIIVRTNWLNQQQLDILSYVYESPEVYILEESTKKVTPVVVKNGTVVNEQKVNHGDNGTLYIYELEFEKATNRIIQSGGTIKNTATYNYTVDGGWNDGGVGGWKPWNGGSLGNWGKKNVENEWVKLFTKSLYE